MLFTWKYEGDEPKEVKKFAQGELGLSRAFMKVVRLYGGQMWAGKRKVRIKDLIHPGETLTIKVPDEEGQANVLVSHQPIDIVYEDRDFLVINKTPGLISIPSRRDPETSVANRVKGYYVRNNYLDQVIHIVTRLDRDTSGLMVIAKHQLAHSMLDKQLRSGELGRRYLAVSHRQDWTDLSGLIDAPIGRVSDSLIERQVHPDGQSAQTKYWLRGLGKTSSLLELQLLTGRTHQIRVHLAHLGGPIVGDDLYGGVKRGPLQRQALHCYKLEMVQPFTGEELVIEAKLPDDISDWVELDEIKMLS